MPPMSSAAGDHEPASLKHAGLLALLAILAALATVASGVAGSPLAAATSESWGAIALAPNGNIGYAADMESAAGAQERALANCAAPDCQVAVTYASSCGGVATTVDRLQWETAVSPDRAAAKEQALAKCQEKWGDCLALSRCSPQP